MTDGTRDRKNIFVLGLDDFHRRQFETIENAGDYAFHDLIGIGPVAFADEYPMDELMRSAIRTLDSFDGSVDGIVGYWDFPTSVLLPMLREHCGLPTPSLESVLRCEHKYWSRSIQKRVLPGMVPEFQAVDPFDESSVRAISLDYPYWLKPVKSHSSYLGFRIHDAAERDRAIRRMREGIAHFGEPLNYAMERADLPPDIAAVDGCHAIAEAMISTGRQCTLEGYVHDGEVVIYGIVDSVRDRKHRSTFARYEYPSRLPVPVKKRMIDAAKAVMRETGLDGGPFNIEFYYNQPHDRLSLLEINARASKSHFPLFNLVDGASNQQILVELALGRRPAFPRGEGRYHAAAKFMYRRYRDAVVSHVPTEAEIDALKAKMPGTEILIEVDKGRRLSTMAYQDSYSYEVAVIFLGGRSHESLLRRYRRLLGNLPLRFERRAAASGTGSQGTESRARA